MLDRAGELALLSFDDEPAKPFIERIDEAERDRSWQLIEPDGTRLMKGPAAMALLEHLRGTRWLARLVRALKLEWLVAAGNYFFYLIRKKSGRFVPDTPAVRRWP